MRSNDSGSSPLMKFKEGMVSKISASAWMVISGLDIYYFQLPTDRPIFSDSGDQRYVEKKVRKIGQICAVTRLGISKLGE